MKNWKRKTAVVAIFALLLMWGKEKSSTAGSGGIVAWLNSLGFLHSTSATPGVHTPSTNALLEGTGEQGTELGVSSEEDANHEFESEGAEAFGTTGAGSIVGRQAKAKLGLKAAAKAKDGESLIGKDGFSLGSTVGGNSARNKSEDAAEAKRLGELGVRGAKAPKSSVSPNGELASSVVAPSTGPMDTLKPVATGSLGSADKPLTTKPIERTSGSAGIKEATTEKAGASSVRPNGDLGDKSANNSGNKEAPEFATRVIRGGVFGPAGMEGNSKPTNLPGFARLFEPQPHTVQPGIGKQVQVYQAIAAGKTWDASTRAMVVAPGADMGYVNWLVNQPHRFGQFPTDAKGNPTGARQEVATLSPYPTTAYQANQAPDEASWKAASDPGMYMIQCAIHPEVGVRYQVELGTNQFERDNINPNHMGDAHKAAAAEIFESSPLGSLTELLSDIPRLAFKK